MTGLYDLLSKYGPLNGNRLNMVIDGKGQTTGVDGSSRSISSAADKALLIHLRSLSDLIITDVATAVAEHYRPSKYARIDVWSKSGNFRGLESKPADGEKQAFGLVHTPNLALAVSNARRNSHYLLFESGKTLSSALASAGLIDELCLTVSSVSLTSNPDQVAESFAATLGLINFEISVKTELDGCFFYVMRD